MAMGKTTPAHEADFDVGGDSRSAAGAAHPFYTRLNQILDKHDFDGYVEGLCQRFYAEDIGRPGLPRTLLSVAADWLLRRAGRRARDRVARC